MSLMRIIASFVVSEQQLLMITHDWKNLCRKLYRELCRIGAADAV